MAFLIDQLNNSGLFAQSAYSAGIATCDSDGNIITATYLSSVDLTPYQTTAGMTAYATTGDVSNKLDATAFSDVSGTFLTAHQSLDGYATTAWVDSQGYLTAHQPISADEWNNVYDTVNVYSGAWTGSESSPTASVDSNGSIDIVSSNNTVYFDVNGTWFNNAVNSALPTSASQWNSNYDTVNTNSGVWGGSALNISAGEGVKVTLVNNNLVFSTDETVLYSATPKNYGGESSGESITLNESISSFERLRFYINVMKGYNSPIYYETYEVDNYLGSACNFQYGPYPENNVTANWFILRAWVTDNICNVSATYNTSTSVQNPDWANKWFPGSLYKVIGINRKNNA